MNELKYPASTVWYIGVRNGEVVAYGMVQPYNVLSTTADIDVYENEQEWLAQLLSLDIIIE